MEGPELGVQFDRADQGVGDASEFVRSFSETARSVFSAGCHGDTVNSLPPPSPL